MRFVPLDRSADQSIDQSIHWSIDWLIDGRIFCLVLSGFFKSFLKIKNLPIGMLDTAEIKNSFQKLGLELDQPEADRLLKRMDANGSLTITFDEFRDYFLWYPSAKVQDLFGYWRHSTVSDAALSAFYYTFPLQRKPNDVFRNVSFSLFFSCSLSILVKTRWYRMILQRKKWCLVCGGGTWSLAVWPDAFPERPRRRWIESRRFIRYFSDWLLACGFHGRTYNELAEYLFLSCYVRYYSIFF